MKVKVRLILFEGRGSIKNFSERGKSQRHSLSLYEHSAHFKQAEVQPQQVTDTNISKKTDAVRRIYMVSACLEATCPVKPLSTEGSAYEEDFFGGDEARAFQPHCRVERGAAICFLSPTWRLICAGKPREHSRQ